MKPNRRQSSEGRGGRRCLATVPLKKGQAEADSCSISSDKRETTANVGVFFFL